MTEQDPNWTPEEAYRILRTALDQFISGELTATGLYNWLCGTYGTPPGTPSMHPAERLFKMAMIDVSVFLQCDFERSDLEESLSGAIRIIEDGGTGGFTKITRSLCFRELMRNGQIPSPLVSVSERTIRQYWEREGFREI